MKKNNNIFFFAFLIFLIPIRMIYGKSEISNSFINLNVENSNSIIKIEKNYEFVNNLSVVQYILGSVSGNVYLDPNGGTISGVGTNADEQLYVNLIENNIVISTQAVAADGTFSFVDIPVGVVVAQLTTVQGIVGQNQPATILPTKLGYRAEGTITGDGNPNGLYEFTINDATNSVVNFAIKDTTDSDGDGIPDVDDLDDDNDGILDSQECPPLFALLDKATVTGSASHNAAITGIRFANGITATLTRVANPSTNVSYATTLRTTGSQNMSNPNVFYPAGKIRQNTIVENTTILSDIGRTNYTITLSEPVESITLHIADWDFLKTQFTGSNQKEELLSGGTELVYDPLTRILRDADPSTFLNNTRDGFGSIKISSRDGQPIQTITFSKMMDILVSNGDGFHYTFSIPYTCDTDGDGTPDILDLDSDNDGCTDAFEGGDKVLASDLVSAGGTVSVGVGSSAENKNLCSTSACVDANGVPIKVNPSGSADYNLIIGQSIGLSQDNSLIECKDSDADGNPDYMDLDDDNDGIVDNDECGNINSFANFVNATFTGANTVNTTISGIQFASAGVTGTFTRILDPVDGASIYTPWVQQTNMIMTDANVYAPAMPGIINAINENITGFKGKATVANYSLTLSRPVTSVTMHFRSFDYMKTKFTGNHKETLLRGGKELEYDQATRELYDRDPLTVENIQRDGNGSIRFTSLDGLPFTTINFVKVDDPASAINSEGYMITFSIDDEECDSDGDGISNHLDLDSDNDGCIDALEGGDDVLPSHLVTAGETLSVGIGSSASNKNLCVTGCVDTFGIPTVVNSGGGADVSGGIGQSVGDSQNAGIKDCDFACYKPGITTGTILSAQHGITSLGRAGSNNGNWPMVRKGAWTVLESKTKGFVPNRLTNAEITALDESKLVVGMMVYNTTLHCIQNNVDGTKNGWKCFNTQSCPDL